MSLRGVSVLLALLLIGGLGGYAAAHATQGDVNHTGDTEPIAAREPAYPAPLGGDEILPDSDLPPLDTTLPMVQGEVSFDGYPVSLLLPQGWDSTDIPGIGTVFARPDHPDGAYSVRVKPLRGTHLPYSKVLERERALQDDQSITDLKILSNVRSASGTIVFSFVKDGFEKLSVVRFAQFPKSANADVEIAWTGRRNDEEAMRQLGQLMAESARRVPS